VARTGDHTDVGAGLRDSLALIKLTGTLLEMVVPALPAEFTARPLTADDADAVTALVGDCEAFDDGATEIDLGDIVALWNRPGVDLAAASVGVLLDGDLVAAGDVFNGRAEVDVHPNHRGRGIGSALLPWTWSVARAQGVDHVGQTISDNRRDAAELFWRHGYSERWTSWILSVNIDDPPHPALPEGHAFRDLDYASDARDVYEVIETAFSEWPDREAEPFDVWNGFIGSHDALAPWASPLVVHNGRIIGVAVSFDYTDSDEGWIHHLAVDKAYRGNGLGRALLEETFRRFHARGRRRCGLATDSRTGALTLYEHVGMRVRNSYTRWAKHLADVE
jgi:GNAT superfamily N-acetyltransferase